MIGWRGNRWKLRKAMSDPDFVSASVRVKQEMEKAGIEIDPRMMEAFASVASRDWFGDKLDSLTGGRGGAGNRKKKGSGGGGGGGGEGKEGGDK